MEKREDYIQVLVEFYKQQGRTQTPEFAKYSLTELRKCLYLFGIETNNFSQESSRAIRWMS